MRKQQTYLAEIYPSKTAREYGVKVLQISFKCNADDKARQFAHESMKLEGAKLWILYKRCFHLFWRQFAWGIRKDE